MLYNVTLRDLSIAGTVIGICLRLHECRETAFSSPMRRRDSLVSNMAIAKIVGQQVIATGAIPTILAVEPPDPTMAYTQAMAEADAQELRQDDVMYRVANEYASHQWMKEAIRKDLAITRGIRRTDQHTRKNMCLLALWLALHDPQFGNAMRERMLDSLRLFNQATLTVACSEKLAYVSSIGPEAVDLTEALRHADKSDRPSIVRG